MEECKAKPVLTIVILISYMDTEPRVKQESQKSTGFELRVYRDVIKNCKTIYVLLAKLLEKRLLVYSGIVNSPSYSGMASVQG